MNTIHIEIPQIPPSLNRFAGRKNFQAYRKAKQDYKEAVMWCCKGKPQKKGDITLCITFYFPDNRRRDYDNYLKPLLDGLTAAGVIVDDSWQELPTIILRAHVDKNNPRVEVDL